MKVSNFYFILLFIYAMFITYVADTQHRELEWAYAQVVKLEIKLAGEEVAQETEKYN